MRKSYLVTGGTGFIGSAVVRRLLEEGNRVRVLDNDMRGPSSRLKDVSGRIDMVRADVRDDKAVRRAVRGVDSVCHLAYLNGTEFFYRRPDLVLDIGVKGMINVIDSCAKEGVKELVLLSSSEVYQTPSVIPTDENAALSIPDPLNPRYSYAGGKIISELMAINYGRKYFRKVIVMRPHNVYGPDMGSEHVMPQIIIRMKKLCRETKERYVKFPIQGSGDQTRAFIFIEDFMEAFMSVIKKGKHLNIYNIGTQEEIPIKNVALAAGVYFGKRVILVPQAPPAGSPLRRCPDITRIKKLGFKQRFCFLDGFNVTAKWYDENTDKGPVRTAGKVESGGIYVR